MTTKSRIALTTVAATLAIATPSADASISGDGDFGAPLVGGTVTRTFTITNDSPTWAAAIAPKVGGSSAFKQESTTCGTVLLAGASCALTVSFKPPAYDEQTGSLEVAFWSFATWTERFTYSGRGSNVDVSANALAFGDQELESIGRAKTLVVSGEQAFTVSRARIVGAHSGEFFLADDGCVGGPAAKQCVFQVRFAPADRGARAAELVVATSAGERRIALSGDGVEAPRPASGPAGPAGANGANGAKGADGASGRDGTNGVDGAQGVAGQPGVTTTHVTRAPAPKAKTAAKKRCRTVKRAGRRVCAKTVVKKAANSRKR